MSAAATAACLAACAHASPDNRASQTGTTSFVLGKGPAPWSGDPTAPSDAERAEPDAPANRLAQSICARKLECDLVGDGKPYTSPQACLTTARRQVHDELDRLDCENGVDDASLDGCIAAARSSPCGPALDTVIRLPACAKNALCGR